MYQRNPLFPLLRSPVQPSSTPRTHYTRLYPYLQDPSSLKAGNFKSTRSQLMHACMRIPSISGTTNQYKIKMRWNTYHRLPCPAGTLLHSRTSRCISPRIYLPASVNILICCSGLGPFPRAKRNDIFGTLSVDAVGTHTHTRTQHTLRMCPFSTIP